MNLFQLAALLKKFEAIGPTKQVTPTPVPGKTGTPVASFAQLLTKAGDAIAKSPSPLLTKPSLPAPAASEPLGTNFKADQKPPVTLPRKTNASEPARNNTLGAYLGKNSSPTLPFLSPQTIAAKGANHPLPLPTIKPIGAAANLTAESTRSVPKPAAASAEPAGPTANPASSKAKPEIPFVRPVNPWPTDASPVQGSPNYPSEQLPTQQPSSPLPIAPRSHFMKHSAPKSDRTPQPRLPLDTRPQTGPVPSLEAKSAQEELPTLARKTAIPAKKLEPQAVSREFSEPQAVSRENIRPVPSELRAPQNKANEAALTTDTLAVADTLVAADTLVPADTLVVADTLVPADTLDAVDSFAIADILVAADSTAPQDFDPLPDPKIEQDPRTTLPAGWRPLPFVEKFNEPSTYRPQATPQATSPAPPQSTNISAGSPDPLPFSAESATPRPKALPRTSEAFPVPMLRKKITRTPAQPDPLPQASPTLPSQRPRVTLPTREKNPRANAEVAPVPIRQDAAPPRAPSPEPNPVVLAPTHSTGTPRPASSPSSDGLTPHQSVPRLSPLTLEHKLPTRSTVHVSKKVETATSPIAEDRNDWAAPKPIQIEGSHVENGHPLRQPAKTSVRPSPTIISQVQPPILPDAKPSVVLPNPIPPQSGDEISTKNDNDEPASLDSTAQQKTSEKPVLIENLLGNLPTLSPAKAHEEFPQPTPVTREPQFLPLVHQPTKTPNSREKPEGSQNEAKGKTDRAIDPAPQYPREARLKPQEKDAPNPSLSQSPIQLDSPQAPNVPFLKGPASPVTRLSDPAVSLPQPTNQGQTLMTQSLQTFASDSPIEANGIQFLETREGRPSPTLKSEMASPGLGGPSNSLSNVTPNMASPNPQEPSTSAIPTADPKTSIPDPSLSTSPSTSAAQVAIVSSEGDLTLHVRVRDGNTHVSLTGSMAPLFEHKEPEVRQVLASEGLQLGNFVTTNQGDGNSHSRTPSEESPGFSKVHPQPTPKRASSELEQISHESGHIHITA